MQPWRIIVRDLATCVAIRGLPQRERLRQADRFDERARKFLDQKIEGLSRPRSGLCVRCDPGDPRVEVLGRGTIPDTDVYGTACALSLWLAAGRRTLRRVGLSLGLSIAADVRDAIVELDADEWWEAIEGDDETRDGAWLGDERDGWTGRPCRTARRVIVCKERPHPGAQPSLFDMIGGLRHTASGGRGRPSGAWGSALERGGDQGGHELGQRPEDVEDHQPGRGGDVDPLSEGPEPDAGGGQVVDGGDQMAQRPALAIEAPHREDAPGPEMVQELVGLRAPIEGPAGLVGPHPDTPCGGEGASAWRSTFRWF